jgi:hypothetical protein
MSDFFEIENELRKLRPVQPSPELFERVKRGIAHIDEDINAADKIVRPARFRTGWVSLGLGLAAAAMLLVLARFDPQRAPALRGAVASATPAPLAVAPVSPAQFIPAGASRVVYHTQDEGLIFPSGSSEPVRRVRSRSRETWQWRNPNTGASLRVSYPSEEVQLIPVTGQ